MLINCPKCNSVYDIDENLIPEKGKKLRCAKCSAVWKAFRDDAISRQEKNESVEELVEEVVVTEVLPEEPIENPPLDSQEDIPAEFREESEAETQEEGEIKEIFDRLASQTQEIFKHDETHKIQKLATESLGLRRRTNRTLLILAILALIALSMFYARYEITRALPAMEKVYSFFGIKSTIPGYGLEFQNITRTEFEEDYVLKLEVKGFIVNTTTQKIKVDNIHIDLMDKDTNILQSLDNKPPMNFVPANERIAFKVVITKPAPLTKYVLLTFTDRPSE